MDLGSINLTAEQISEYINTGLTGIVAIGVTGFIVGFIKGFWKQSFSFYYYLVCFALLILFTKNIADAVYTIDMYSIINRLNIPIPGFDENVNTIGEYIRNFIIQFFEANSIQTSEDLFIYAEAIAISIIKFGIYVVGLSIVVVLEFILCPLLYHLIFKFIIPKNVRKNKKARFLGGVVGFIQNVLVFCLLLTPFSAFINSMIGNLRDENGQIQINPENTDELYQLLTNFLEGYNNSILANTLFTVTLDGKTLDVALMDFVTGSNLTDDLEFKLFDEFGKTSSVLVDLFSSGAIDLSAQALNLTVLLESTFVKNTFYTLSESSLVNVCLPIVASLALNNVNANIDLSNLDLSQVDWSDTLCAVGDVFESIQKTGYIQTVLENPETFMESIPIDRSNEANLKKALSRLGNSTLVNTLMPQLITSYLQSIKGNDINVSHKENRKQMSNDNEGDNSSNESSSNFDLKKLLNELPDEAYQVSTYQDISWGDELSIMLEVVLKISDQIKAVNQQDLTLADVMTVFTPDLFTETLLGINDNIKYETYDDYLINVYVNGGNLNQISIPGTKEILGCGPADSKGLLDLKIMEKILVNFKAMDKVIPLLFNVIGEDLIENTEGIEIKISEETSKWSILDWKEELASLIPLAVPLFTTIESMTEEGVDTITALTSDKTITALNFFADFIDDSFLLNEIAPDILQSFVSKESNNIDLFFGLKLSDFNFNEFTSNHSFATELKTIVNELLPKINDVMSLVEDGFSVDLVIDNSTLLSDIMNCIYKCQITNKPLSEEEVSMGALTNFETMMVNLFYNPTQEEIDNGFDTSINIPTITSGLFSIDKNTILSINDNWWTNDGRGEIDSLFNFFASIKDKNSSKNYIYELITGGEIDIENDIYSMGEEIERIFAAIDESILLKDAFPNTITKAMDGSSLSSLVDFYQVEDWANEGEAFAKVLNNLSDIRNGENDIGNVVLNCDNDLIKEYDFEKSENHDTYQEYNGNYHKYFLSQSKAYRLLTDVNNTQSINLQDFVYDTLATTLSPEESDSTIVDHETYELAESDFKFEERQNIYQIIDDKTYYVSWNYEEETSLATDYYGEIYNLSRILTYASSLENLDSLDQNILDDLLKVCIKSYPMRKIIGPIIENSLNEVKNTSNEMLTNILDACDFKAFDRLTNEIRAIEIEKRLCEVDAISEVYSQKESLSNMGNDFDNNVIDLTLVDLETNESKLTKLLSKMHDSEIFNSSDIIAKVDSINKRTSLTAFESVFKEIFKMKSDLFDEISDLDLFELNNKTNLDKWINNGQENGEITNFNKAIYDTMSSDVYDVVVSNGASYDSLTELYKGDKTNHLETLSLNLKDSILLSKQLTKIYDEYVYQSLKDNISSVTTDGGYLLANRPYSSYSKVTESTIDWGKEGAIIDSLIKKIAINGIDFSSDQTSNFKSDDVKYIFDTLDDSDVLHYSSSEIRLDDSIDENKERSFNEYLVCVFESKIIDRFYDESTNIFNIEDINNQKTFITTNDITSYENEEDVLYRFVLAEKKLNDSNLLTDNGFTFTSYSNLNKETLLSLSELIDELYNILADSEVFNFKIKGNGEDYIKGTGENAYMNRTTYEHAVIYLSKQIRTSMVESFNLIDSDGYIINNNSHNLLESVYDFMDYEQEKLINVINNYAEVVSVLSESMGINAIFNNKDGIKNIISAIKESKVLNHTIEKVSNDLSLYDNVTLFLVNKVNVSLLDALSITNETSSVINIINNKYLKDNQDYQDEIDLILDDGGLIDITNQMNFEGSNIEFKIDSFNDPNNPLSKAKVLELLETIYQSKCLNYTRGDEGYVGRLTSSFDELSVFEDVILKVFAQENIVDLVYDKNNLLQDSYLPENSKNGLSVMKHKIKEINDNSNTYLSSVNFFDIGLNKGEVNKLFDFLDGLTDSSNLSFTNIDDAVDSLKSIAKIYILHDMVAKEICKITTEQQISSSNIRTISDLAIINSPQYYVFEYDQTLDYVYSEFNIVADLYDEELDAIVNLKNAAEKSIISGDLVSLTLTPEDSLFEDIVVSLGLSKIYQSIASDAIVKITNQMSISIFDTKYELSSFITADLSLEPDNDIEKERYRANLAVSNFVEHNNDYQSIGASIDDFLYYSYQIVKMAQVDRLNYIKNGVMDELLGFHMAENFDKLVDGKTISL